MRCPLLLLKSWLTANSTFNNRHNNPKMYSLLIHVNMCCMLLIYFGIQFAVVVVVLVQVK